MLRWAGLRLDLMCLRVKVKLLIVVNSNHQAPFGHLKSLQLNLVILYSRFHPLDGRSLCAAVLSKSFSASLDPLLIAVKCLPTELWNAN